MKTLFITSALLLSVFAFAQNKQTDSTAYRDARIYDDRMGKFLMPDSVFVCGNDSSLKFHFKPDCKGLANCKHPIGKEPYISAINHRELCGYEK